MLIFVDNIHFIFWWPGNISEAGNESEKENKHSDHMLSTAISVLNAFALYELMFGTGRWDHCGLTKGKSTMQSTQSPAHELRGSQNADPLG